MKSHRLLVRRAAAAAVALLAVLPTIGAAGSGVATPPRAGGSRPVLTWATFWGSSGLSDAVNDATVDTSGNLYVVGGVDGTGLPVSEGAYQPAAAGGAEAFVAKFDPAGDLVFSTYFGGTHHEGANAVGVGVDGSVYIVGTTLSRDLPVTPGSLQTDFRGNVAGCEFACSGDAFVARLAADGSDLVYSTFLGGGASEVADEVIVDASGAAYVAGFTSSPDFPATPGAFDTGYNTPTCFDQCEADAFVARLTASGARLDFATFYGGTSWDSVSGLGLDDAGNIYVAGSTRSVDLATTSQAYQPEKNGNGDFDFSAFVAAFTPDAGELRYGTYLGTRREDHATAIDVRPDGTAWLTGFTSRGFPVTPDALQRQVRGSGDAFVSAFSPDGSALEYSTLFGGDREDYGRGIAVDEGDRVTLAGSSSSSDLETRRAWQRRSGGFDDLFLTRFRRGAERVRFATYLGGEGFETATGITVAEGGAIFVTGSSESRRMPLAGRFVQDDQTASDGVIVRFDPGGVRRVRIEESGFSRSRVLGSVGRSTIAWTNAASARRRVVERGTGLFDGGRRPGGSTYAFTFPAGRFVVSDITSGARQRVAIAPHARYGGEPNEIEIVWAQLSPGAGFAFDVQVKRGDGGYEPWLEATPDLGAVFHDRPDDYRFRVRLRNLDTGDTSGWSPPALLSRPN